MIQLRRLIQGRARTIAVGALALVVLAAGWLVLDRWSEQRVLDEACDGVLAADETRAVLGEGKLAEQRDRIRREGGLNDEKRTLSIQCKITRVDESSTGEGSVEVTVQGVPTLEGDRGQRNGSLYWGTEAERPVPLGHGWTGFFDGDSEGRDSEATAAVLLDCPEGRSDLLVTVVGHVTGTTSDNPDDRTRLARIATGTAHKSAERFGCEARLGKPLRTVPLPVAEDESVELRRATGTCAGVPDGRTRSFRAWESGRGDAPRARCTVGTGQFQTYDLDAYYGPYAEDMRFRMASDGMDAVRLVASAVCPAGQSALYAIRRDGGQEAVAHERAALKAFAARSAKDHGCSALTDPVAPTKPTAPADPDAPANPEASPAGPDTPADPSPVTP
ncbi:hypothetical protein [Streptomyces sp. NPDC020681]|uniref:hypothetical protein n=1 Tax=Streptomyces sp. NPDC020681 TaxID=3365083 RepID=UPI0037AC6464